VRALAPELTRGLPGTLLLALVVTTGRVVIPVAIQQIIDHGLRGAEDDRGSDSSGRVDLSLVAAAVGVAAAVIAATAFAGWRMNVRLYRMSESALATLRTRAFRHVHDLSVLTQSAQRRGGLTARVTTDIDQMSQFLQTSGIVLLMSVGQMLIATVLMVVYSWPLALLVYVCFAPMVVATRHFQRALGQRYRAVRERVGDLLGSVSEAVVGAAVVRAYGVRDRVASRADASVEAFREAQTRAQRLIAAVFSGGELVAGLATAAVVVAGVALGAAGHLTTGALVAFLFLLTLFVAPVQMLTEVLNDGANALAGVRRVLDVLDMRADVRDPAQGGPPGPPGPAGRDLPPGPLGARFEHVWFSYPGGPLVLRDVTIELPEGSHTAVVGETGSGKTTIAKLLTRLMDPERGEITIGGVRLSEARFASLRRRVVMVPQDGFLFDASIADNVRYGRPEASDDDVAAAFAALRLADWLAGLPAGVATRVGERGERLSVGERQLVALARARVADPDLLVLDEATSAVDPATEVAVAAALTALTRGRTSVTIAHRLSTAMRADQVLVVDAGVVVQRGTHAELAAVDGVYRRLFEAWNHRA
jgi:ABC-type multidrug transport system fused ATPase/permease subunit